VGQRIRNGNSLENRVMDFGFRSFFVIGPEPTVMLLVFLCPVALLELQTLGQKLELQK
jgi:hypothetical protein